MPLVDVTGAAWRLQTQPLGGYPAGQNAPGYCLQWVNLALLSGRNSVGPYAGMYGTAMDAWNYGAQNHPNDWYPPLDMPVYFGPSPTRTDVNRNAGDVAISLGNGYLVCTDGAGGGTVGVLSITQRANQIERPYLGWGQEQCGYDMTTAALSQTISPPRETKVINIYHYSDPLTYQN